MRWSAFVIDTATEAERNIAGSKTEKGQKVF